MSKMILRSNGRPPLPRSPISLRPRRSLVQPTANKTVQTPPGSLTKSQKPNRNMDVEQSELRPGCHTVSCELRTLAKMVQNDLGGKDENEMDGGDVFGAPLFERGRFYDDYAAIRNERLKRKKGEMEGYEKKTGYGYDLGVRVDSMTNKRGEVRKFESRRKTVAVAVSTPMSERRVAQTTSRYSLRSTASKENKKPPLAMTMNIEKSVGVTTRKTVARSLRNK